MPVKQDKIRVVENPNYRTINVAGAIGSFHELGIQVTLYSEELDTVEALSTVETENKEFGIKRTLECRLALDPYGAIDLRNLLDHHISLYEQNHGKITMPDNKITPKDDSANPLAQ